ncbi:MAG: thiamine-phosphate kinase [Candidatus Wallbacteria bacterium HGW-Wallbacteria-1]|jgi:thiamine-monophosphate kinase|uniref:Thiamine-monophosphate kinase n=1 Tax=Candidatus Wallbacteria bacterium HGW-Wallbacteria-1 TaxID=2013854 RepID=A0A2N1PN65_9BACT|nr:MAG: thiamine-phosphate kinase [Candidatus Wallbacteria bacterium HGW-Wallbacteria-1]
MMDERGEIFTEFGFIDDLMNRAVKAKGVDCISSSENIPVSPLGPGDDCSVLDCMNTDFGLQTLVTKDIMSEDIHFSWKWISPAELGYKVMAVNLSDIAAMGGRPLQAFAGLSLRGSDALSIKEKSEGILNGIIEACSEFDVLLCGGDTCASAHGDFISITLTGESVPDCLGRGRAVLRSGAVPGDSIILLGSLGESAAGLRLLEMFGRSGDCLLPDSMAQLDSTARFDLDARQRVIYSHIRPEPLVPQAQRLARASLLNSLIDISDGLVQDLGHICRQSKVGMVLNEAGLEPGMELGRICSKYGWNSLDLILSGGEDYALAGTASRESTERILSIMKQEFPLCPVAVIGEVISRDSQPGAYESDDGSAEGDRVEGALSIRCLSGDIISLEKKGWDHFADPGQ